tara:strand:- start:368 stop:796 length:429 start_codon:yes stop_codon:yes gene_type:complete
MKKITIALLAVFFIGISNVNAQTETKEVASNVVNEKDDQKIIVALDSPKKCVKTGKICEATCENKKNGTCCKGEKKKSCSKTEKNSCSKSKAKCTKSKKGDFDYGTTNDYSGVKSSCSKNAKKGCNNGGEKKGCSKKTETKE